MVDSLNLNYFRMKRMYAFLNQHKRLSLFLAISWTIIIFIGCSIPGKELPSISLFDQSDKLIHFIFFAVFFILWSSYYQLSAKNLIFLLIVASAYGFALEFYQLHFVSGRSFDVWDGIADTAGALFALSLVRMK